MRRLLPVALVLTFLVGASPARPAGPSMAFGAAEDVVRQSDPVVARQKMAELAAAGVRALPGTSLLVPPATAPPPGGNATVTNVAPPPQRDGGTADLSVFIPGSE